MRWRVSGGLAFLFGYCVLASFWWRERRGVFGLFFFYFFLFFLFSFFFCSGGRPGFPFSSSPCLPAGLRRGSTGPAQPAFVLLFPPLSLPGSAPSLSLSLYLFLLSRLFLFLACASQTLGRCLYVSTLAWTRNVMK